MSLSVLHGLGGVGDDDFITDLVVADVDVIVL